jgi:hypothetical protein
MIRKATEVWPQILLTRNQRQWLTRALCWWVFASAALEMTIAVILIAWWFVVAEESWHLVWMLSVRSWRGVGRAGPSRPYECEAAGSPCLAFHGLAVFGAIISMALRGTTHCMWCGHSDGAELEYVIKQ